MVNHNVNLVEQYVPLELKAGDLSTWNSLMCNENKARKVVKRAVAKRLLTALRVRAYGNS